MNTPRCSAKAVCAIVVNSNTTNINTFFILILLPLNVINILAKLIQIKFFTKSKSFTLNFFCSLIFNSLRYISCEKFYKARQSFTCISKFAPI